jgi:hypothetical protein
MDFFFETKGRSIVISFKKKKKKQLYITHRIEHHHTQTTHTHNTHTHTTKITRYCTTMTWEKSQRSRRNPRCRRQRCATAKAATRCKLKRPPELFHRELSPTSCTQTVIDLSALMLFR